MARRGIVDPNSVLSERALIDDSQGHKLLRLFSTCIVQIKKIIAPSIDTARGHTTSGARVNEVTSPAAEQKMSAPIAFRKPAPLRNARCPIEEAARRAATATNPKIRGPSMPFSTDRAGGRHATDCERQKGETKQSFQRQVPCRLPGVGATEPATEVSISSVRVQALITAARPTHPSEPKAPRAAGYHDSSGGHFEGPFLQASLDGFAVGGVQRVLFSLAA
jgi:hypothetical protein